MTAKSRSEETRETVAETPPQTSNQSAAAARSACSPEFLKECDAIIVYIARRGDIWKDNADLKKAYIELVKRMSACKDRVPDAGEYERLAGAYADVTRFTYEMREVNGRSVLDTWDADDVSKVWRGIPSFFKPLFVRHRRPLLWAVVLTLTAITLQILAAGAERYYVHSCMAELNGAVLILYYAQVVAGWAGRLDLCGAEAELWTSFLYRYSADSIVAPLLVPAAWGGIGSCVFLMKRISDELFEFAYQRARLQGYGSRICLGAILGVLVVQLFVGNGDVETSVSDVTLTPLTLAFVAGLGVKPVYAAFEAVVEFLTTRLPGRGETRS